jgi:hypothetical protein
VRADQLGYLLAVNDVGRDLCLALCTLAEDALPVASVRCDRWSPSSVLASVRAQATRLLDADCARLAADAHRASPTYHPAWFCAALVATAAQAADSAVYRSSFAAACAEALRAAAVCSVIMTLGVREPLTDDEHEIVDELLSQWSPRLRALMEEQGHGPLVRRLEADEVSAERVLTRAGLLDVL